MKRHEIPRNTSTQEQNKRNRMPGENGSVHSSLPCPTENCFTPFYSHAEYHGIGIVERGVVNEPRDEQVYQYRRYRLLALRQYGVLQYPETHGGKRVEPVVTPADQKRVASAR